jgi:hypothetical protein
LPKRLLELVQFAGDSNFQSIYRPIKEYPRTERPEAKGLIVSIYDALVGDQTHGSKNQRLFGRVPINWPNVKKLRVNFIETLQESHIDADELDVVIDVPYGKAAREMLYVLVGSTETEEQITEVSNLPESIFTEPAAFTSPVRIYFSPRVFSQLSERDLQDICINVEDRFYKRENLVLTSNEKPTIV